MSSRKAKQGRRQPVKKIAKNAPKGLKAAMKKLQHWGAEYVRFETPDVHGIAYNKVVPVRHFERFATDGLNMCSIMLYAGPQSAMAAEFLQGGEFKETGYPDMYLFPDLSTLKMVPWAKTKVARVLCGPKWMRNGKWEVFPQTREICKNMLKQLSEEHGLHLLSAFEFEFMLMKTRNGDADLKEAEWVPAWKGTNLFTNLYNSKNEEFVAKCEKYMHQMGVDFNTMNVEYGNGQVEWTFMPSADIKGADDAYTFKNGMKEIAQQEGRRACFMTRPFPQAAGCSNGAHFNHSLFRMDGGKKVNVFHDPEKENGMSDIMRKWTAGLLKHGPALQAFSAPTTNCYHRVQLGSWAPVNTTHGIQNRTAMIREKVGSRNGTYLEYRSPSAAVNPYLVMAAVVAAGLDGLESPDEKWKKNILSAGAVQGDAYAPEFVKPELMLPNTLQKAIDALDADDGIKAAMGAQFIQWYKFVKNDEIKTIVNTTKDLPEKERDAKRAEKAREVYMEMI